jgi:hypothetical protein
MVRTNAVRGYDVNPFLTGQLLMRVYHAVFLSEPFVLEETNHAIALFRLWF